jgi:hypothetical protein
MKKFLMSPQNFISFLIALVSSMILWFFEPSDTVSYSFFAVSIVLNFALLWFSAMTWLKSKNTPLPAIEILRKIDDDILLCRPNELLSQDAFVSFYLQNNDFEQPIGYGFVQNVQSNKLVQVRFSEPIDDFSIDVFFDFTKIIIKPTVSIQYLKAKSFTQEVKNV